MPHAMNTTMASAVPDTRLDALILAIIRQAMKDREDAAAKTRHSMYNRKHRERLEEVNAFFGSGWFTVLTGMKGEDFLRKAYPPKAYLPERQEE